MNPDHLLMTDADKNDSAQYDLSDPASWSEIVQEHYDGVLRAALGQTRRRSLAEEVAQETFVRAFERYHQFDGQGSLGGWLHRIAVNLSRDVLRRENVRSHAELSEAHQTSSGEPHPSEVAHRKHLSRVLREALDDISPPMRRAFEQTVVLGYSYRQAAEIEGVSEGTIASRVARTRNALARKYRDLDA
jgi:RNA polymerase sigma-70 factor (ECF subfamily)